MECEKMRDKKYLYTTFALIVLILISSVINQDFLSVSNFITVLRQSGVLLILSLGLTGVVLTGNIDLSVGAVAALSGCVCGKLLVMPVPVGIAICLSMGVGILAGICNGCLVGVLNLPSFVATYGMNMVVNGLAVIVMNGGIIYGLPEGFTELGIGTVGKIPILILIAGMLFIVLLFLYQYTTFGRRLYMIGHNRQAARYSGIPCLKTLLGVYILCGMTGSLGGILLTARLNAADAGMSETYGLQIVAAVVLGGTSLLGGEGGVTGTVMGAFLLTLIVNIMNINGIDSNWQNFVLGIIILIIVWFDGLSRKTSLFSRRQKKNCSG